MIKAEAMGRNPEESAAAAATINPPEQPTDHPTFANADPNEDDSGFAPATGNPEAHDYLDYYRYLKRTGQLEEEGSAGSGANPPDKTES